ncbi:hypothetical protein C5167_017954 [Papaver somniferum]|uniref:Uncharacterized protein n=1 Tax=Papaver somniferum TaxID=3469 RepID=A0A4Y7IKV1_PAPSO|nr:hypothetical protein C5167_017954 [Papaver somniferum]
MDPVFYEFYRDRYVYGVADDIVEVTTSIGEWFVWTKTLDFVDISHVHVRSFVGRELFASVLEPPAKASQARKAHAPARMQPRRKKSPTMITVVGVIARMRFLVSLMLKPAAKKNSSSEESSLDEEPAEDAAVKKVSMVQVLDKLICNLD